MPDHDEDLSKLEPDEALDRLLDEARAGASDQWLAQRADVSLSQVRLWKKKHGIVRGDGGTVGESMAALQQLSVGFNPAMHQVEAEGAQWAPPEYVLRDALQYTHYCRMCHGLKFGLGWSTREIAQATGTRLGDIEDAIAKWIRWLARNGQHCPGCGALIDPRFQTVCSRSCHGRATR